jgi:hypothetical protein
MEVVPLANLQHCLEQMGAIDDFSAEHRDAHGYGWNSIYVRPESPTLLVELAIDVEAVRNALAAVLPEFDRVTTGWGSHVEPCKNTFAFGHDRGPVIFVSHTGGVADAIWCSEITMALRQLPRRDELLLANWCSSVAIPLKDDEALLRCCE